MRMRLSSSLLVLTVSIGLLAALSAGCATRAGVRTEGTVTINQSFVDTPLRKVLVAIEKASTMGIAVGPSVDLDQKITLDLQEVSPDEAVDAVAKIAGYQWAFDRDLPDKVKNLRGQYWPYPMYLIAAEIDRSVFAPSEEEVARTRWLARFQEGEKLYEAGDYAQAQTVLEEVQASGVSLGRSTDRKLKSHLAQIDEEMAQTDARKELRSTLAKGVELHKAGEYQAAIDIFSEVEGASAAGEDLRNAAADYRAKAEANLQAFRQRNTLLADLTAVRELLAAGEFSQVLDKAEQIEAQNVSLGPENDAALREYKRLATAGITEQQRVMNEEQKSRDNAQQLYDKAASLYSDGNYHAAKQAYSDLTAMAKYLTSSQLRNVEKRLASIDERIARKAEEEERKAQERIEEARKQKWLGKFETAEKLYDVGNYRAAKAAFEEVRSADVALGWSVNRRISNYLKDIERKLAEEKKLDDVKQKLAAGIQHYEAGNYRTAITLFSEVEESKLATWTLRSSATEHREMAEAKLQAERQRETLIAELSGISNLLQQGRYEEAISAAETIEAAGISLGDENDARLREYKILAQTKMAEELQKAESERMARAECQQLLNEASALYLAGEMESAKEVYGKLATMTERLDTHEVEMVASRLGEIDRALALQAATAVKEAPKEPVSNSAPSKPEPTTPEAVKLAIEQEEAERLAKQPTVSNVFISTDIREAVSDMAAQTGVNIITDASVEGWVTLSLDAVPLERALSMMCLSGGFAWKNMGDYYLVGAATPESVNYALLSKTKAIRTDLPASQIKSRLSEFFVPYTRVASDDDHTLVVTGPAAVVDNVINTISEIDKPRHQIRIDAVVTEISWSASDDTGMNWMNTLMDIDAAGTMEFTEGLKPAYSSAIVGTIISELSALAETGKIDIKANPSIITLEGETAEIKIVEERYFSILTGSLNYPTSDLEIIQSGVILKVTPSVTRSGDILMSIVPDVSDVTGTGGGREDLPIITRRSVESNVRVSDGETVILGGLLKHLSKEVVRKIPLLGDIPIISFAFRNKATMDTETELIVFITPKILSD